MDTPTTLVVIATVVSACATATLAYYAYQQGEAIEAAKIERAASARATIAFLAFGLRRQITSWLEYFADNGLRVWIGTNDLAPKHLDAAEERVRAMVERSGDLPKAEREVVEEVAALFFTATHRLLDSISPGHAAESHQLTGDAEDEFRILATRLDSLMDSTTYLATERRLLEDRPRESIGDRLARIIALEEAARLQHRDE